MRNVIILDTETTGLTKIDKVIELAIYDVTPLEVERAYIRQKLPNLRSIAHDIDVTRYNPRCMIHPQAYAVHGIGLIELQDCSPSSLVDLPEAIDYIVGHNITYDIRLLLQSNPDLDTKLKDTKYICTMALAKAIDKHSNIGYENHKLDTLAEHYYPEYKDILVTELHSAKNDVLKTLLVLLKLVEHLPALQTWDDVHTFQESLKKTKAKPKGAKTV